MNIKRSYFKLLMASATVGLFLANCTVKNSTDDSCEKGDKDTGCSCPGEQTGYQVCNSEGVFGSCICPDDNSGAGTGNTSTAGKNSSTGGTDGGGGEPPSTGGKTYTAGTNSGAGVASVTAGAGGEGGAGPVATTYESCSDCLDDLCKAELDACLADEACFSADGLGGGEYEAISDCIEKARAEVDDVVKRDRVRSCGVTFGASSDPEPDFSSFSDWAPRDMAATTTNLLNCMATSSSKEPDAKWANDPANFPNNMPVAWPADSCAKLACTSAK
jgi:hypothetical protein